ncbi:Uncharacterised protein [Corynebacterium minutissimum]|uniref:Secreted protein n=1 Tax=Corynebacterium minutissimum TaxID=38301 RepID=A0A2X4UFA9_9CORY|nr:Uncharacterised protein [Corynebacterium minutissimum]VEG04838.1 Uncharacterised protein [Corynebacterium minutissimum]
MRKVLSCTVPTTVLSIALIFSPPALADSSPMDEGTTNDSFTFTFGDEDMSSRTHSLWCNRGRNLHRYVCRSASRSR